MRRAILIVVAAIACGDGKRDGQLHRDSATATDTVASAIPAAAANSATVTDTLSAADSTPLAPAGSLLTPWGVGVDSMQRQQTWFVLRRRQDVTELIPTRVDTATVAGACGNQRLSPRPLAINGDWIMMLSNITGLRAGAIETAVTSSEEMPGARAAGDSVSFSFRGERVVIRSELAADSTLRLYHEGKNGRGELLANHAHTAGVWWLTWVGDLNRDGAADLLVQTSGRDLQRYQWLYMSGTVAADRRWRPAAVESHEGCGE